MENNNILSCFSQESDLQDIFKFLFQSCFGCEHLLSDEASALAMLRQEMLFAEQDDLPEMELLDGAYCRVHLKILHRGLSPETLCKLFFLSSEKCPDGKARLEQKLQNLLDCAKEGLLPFSENEVSEKISIWRDSGFPALHHSESYRAAHHPAYRVIRQDFLRLLPLLTEIDRLLCSDMQSIIIALDGRCASGKTTMAATLSQIYDCNVFHMDDFFLRPVQRTAERLSQPGENIDHERFWEEILHPLSEGRAVCYRKYNCARQALEPPITAPQKRLHIIEGVYSLHPRLFASYDLTVLADTTKEVQRERILRRNSPEMAEKFFSVWIPMEEAYFLKENIREKVNLIL